MTHPNEDLVRAASAAFGRRDPGALRDLSPDSCQSDGGRLIRGSRAVDAA